MASGGDAAPWDVVRGVSGRIRVVAYKSTRNVRRVYRVDGEDADELTVVISEKRRRRE